MTIEVHRVGRALGARVSGIDLGTDLDESTFAAVRATMHEAVGDYGPEDARYMHRATISGDTPIA